MEENNFRYFDTSWVNNSTITLNDYNSNVVAVSDNSRTYEYVELRCDINDLREECSNNKNLVEISINQNEALKNEIRDLKKCLAYLNTRVNNLIAEKQMKENGEN